MAPEKVRGGVDLLREGHGGMVLLGSMLTEAVEVRCGSD